MIDTLAFDSCMNQFETCEALLSFLIESNPEQVRVVLSRDPEQFSRQTYTRPYEGWDAPGVLAELEAFVARAGAEVAP